MPGPTRFSPITTRGPIAPTDGDSGSRGFSMLRFLVGAEVDAVDRTAGRIGHTSQMPALGARRPGVWLFVENVEPRTRSILWPHSGRPRSIPQQRITDTPGRKLAGRRAVGRPSPRRREGA